MVGHRQVDAMPQAWDASSFVTLAAAAVVPPVRNILPASWCNEALFIYTILPEIGGDETRDIHRETRNT